MPQPSPQPIPLPPEHPTPRESLKPKTIPELAAYAQWKSIVPKVFRNMVEGAMLGSQVAVPNHFTPLVSEFLHASNVLFKQPGADQNAFVASQPVLKFLQQLSAQQLSNGTTINVFAHLTNPNVSWTSKTDYFQGTIQPRLNWLITEDQKPPKQSEDANTEDKPTEVVEQPPEQDTLKPQMDGGEESNETPMEGFVKIHPYFGGLHPQTIYDIWNPATKEWEKGTRTLQPIESTTPIQEGTLRTITQKLLVNQITPIPLSKKLAILPASFDCPPGITATVFEDQFGMNFIKLVGQPSTETVSVSYKAGVRATPFICQTPPTVDPSTIAKSALPQEVTAKIEGAKTSTLPSVQKAKMLAAFCRNHFTYSKDAAACNAACPPDANHFLNLWKHIHINCKPTNTFTAEVLRQAGIPVMMSAGHSVQSPTPEGSALLHGGNGHAWLWAWSTEENRWFEVDATPEGDPNVNQQEQEQSLDPNTPLDGNETNQEAEVMSDEQVSELKKEYDKSEQLNQMKEKLQNLLSPEEWEQFQKQLEEGCTNEDIRNYKNQIAEYEHIIKKILALRNLTDEEGNNLLQTCTDLWEEVVKKNLVEQEADESPLPLSQSDGEIDDDYLIDVVLQVRGNVKDPIGFKRRTIETEEQELFGGFEIYIAADGSGSTELTDPATQQAICEAQRDAVFLYCDAIMHQAMESARMESRLRQSMPVTITVIIFSGDGKLTAEGGDKAIITVALPTTGEWTPREQVKLYRALNERPKGGTHDHKALEVIEKLIEQSKEREEEARDESHTPLAPLHRMVNVFADGGSNEPQVVRAKLASMRKDPNTVVYGFGMTESGKAMEATYAPHAQTVKTIQKLPSKAISKFIKHLKKWYGLK